MYGFIILLWITAAEAVSKGRSMVENLQQCEQCFGFGQGVKRQDVSTASFLAVDALEASILNKPLA